MKRKQKKLTSSQIYNAEGNNHRFVWQLPEKKRPGNPAFYINEVLPSLD